MQHAACSNVSGLRAEGAAATRLAPRVARQVAREKAEQLAVIGKQRLVRLAHGAVSHRQKVRPRQDPRRAAHKRGNPARARIPVWYCDPAVAICRRAVPWRHGAPLPRVCTRTTEADVCRRILLPDRAPRHTGPPRASPGCGELSVRCCECRPSSSRPSAAPA